MPIFTLTMLGTDTVYTPKLKSGKKPSNIQDYPKSELLSAVATLIETNQSPQINRTNPITYQAHEVAVINGPESLGSNVGEKIALGLAATLKAIAKGQTIINIIAHSRGAVESILLAHELEAIKSIISECENIGELLAHLSRQQRIRHGGRPTNNTPDIIATLKAQFTPPTTFNDEWFQLLKNNISSTSINFFGIDPVPGDVRISDKLTWYDERFFTLPSIIKKATIIHYENERTDWGFTPIYPEPVNSEQKIISLSMPGHHGTGSAGNNASQQKKVVSPPGTKSTHVQKLILYKILDFLNQNGVTFKDGQEIFRYGRGLGRKYAIPITNPPESTKRIDISQLDFPKIYHELYTKIEENRAAYRAFNQTNYWMGGLLAHRRMLRTGHRYGQFNDVYPPKEGYVNAEHSQLMQAYFFRLLNLESVPINLADMINMACTELTNKIGQIRPEQHEDVLKTFGIMVQQVSQKYLNEEWDGDARQAEKQRFFTASVRVLETFSGHEASRYAAFFKQLAQLGLSEMVNTVKAQVAILEEQFNRLQDIPDNKLIHFFKGLLTQFHLQKSIEEQVQEAMQEDAPEIETIFGNIVRSEPYQALTNHPMKDKISYVWEQLKDSHPPQEPAFIEQLLASFDEQYGEHLEDFEKLYVQTQVLIDDITAIHQIHILDDEWLLSLRECEDILHNQISPELIKTAAQRFYQERPHDLPEIATQDGFLKLAERYAIDNYGLTDRSQKPYVILNNKLIELTGSYLKKLQTSAKKDGLLSQKVDLIEQLLHCLVDEESISYASNRVRAFYTQLNAHPALVLKEHRDPAWKRYLANIFIAAGVLLSGVIVGLFVLIAYNEVRKDAGKSCFFWRAAGDNLIRNLNQHAPSEMLPDLNDPPQTP